MNKNIISLIENPTLVRGISANVITGASGGFLFNSLFDGHPEILPVYFRTRGYELDHYYYYTNRFSAEKCADSDHYIKCLNHWGFHNHYAQIFGIRHKADEMKSYMVEAFLNLKKEDITYYNLYYIQQIALAAILDYPLTTDTPLVMIHRHFMYPHNFRESYAEADTSCYINYIHLIRYPPKSLDFIYHSIIDWKYSNNMPPGFSYFYPFFYYYYNDTHKYFPKEKLFAIRFEDLHLRTEEILRLCCTHMGIEYLPAILLKSTEQHQDYHFNRPGAPEFAKTGFATSRAFDGKVNYLNFYHKFFLSYFLENFNINYGYKKNKSKILKINNLIFPFLFLILLFPTKSELTHFFRFLIFFFKSKNMRSSVYSFSNFVQTIHRLPPTFPIAAVDKTKTEKFIIYSINPVLYFSGLQPLCFFLKMKFKIAVMFFKHRFGKNSFPPLINKTRDLIEFD